jgi:hypothetical protein
MFKSIATVLANISAAVMAAMPAVKFGGKAPVTRHRGKKPVRIRAGKTYPHSSKRQRARYARQIAAGQLHMDGV